MNLQRYTISFAVYYITRMLPALCVGWGFVPYDRAFGAPTCGQGMLHTIASLVLSVKKVCDKRKNVNKF